MFVSTIKSHVALSGHAGHCTAEPTGVDLRHDCGMGTDCSGTCGPGGANVRWALRREVRTAAPLPFRTRIEEPKASEKSVDETKAEETKPADC